MARSCYFFLSYSLDFYALSICILLSMLFCRFWLSFSFLLFIFSKIKSIKMRIVLNFLSDQIIFMLLHGGHVFVLLY